MARFLRPLFFLVICTATIAGSSALFAQNVQRNVERPRNLNELGAALTYYYQRPFNIPQFLSEWEHLADSRPEVMIGLIGFLAGIFTKYPDQIRPIATAQLGQKTQPAVITALRLAGRLAEAKSAAERWGWPPERIASLTALRPLIESKVQLPGDFDVMWAASFATGDAAYVRPIYDYYATVASQSDVDVRDIVTLAMSRHRPNKEGVDAITKKYPREVLVRVMYATSALWSLESNARQHKFVNTALDQYAKELPHSSAIKGLGEMRSAVRMISKSGTSTPMSR